MQATRSLPTPAALLLGAGLALAGPSPRASEADGKRSDAILEAVVLYELAHFTDRGDDAARVCLTVVAAAGETDPSAALLRRLRERAEVRPGSECSVERSGVRFGDSGEPATLLAVGPITWVAADEARVAARSFRGPASSARPVYRVVLQQRRWVCLGPIIEGIPL